MQPKIESFGSNASDGFSSWLRRQTLELDGMNFAQQSEESR